MRHHQSNAFGAFLAGAVIGGALALLFAPRSGAQTREMIRDFVDDEIDAARSKAADAREFVDEQVDKYRRKARKAVDEIEEMVAEAKDCVAGEIAEAKRAARR